MDLKSYLEENQVSCDWSRHDPAYTAQDLAMKEHVSGKKVIKPVIVQTERGFVMCALPASCYVDIESLRRELHSDAARLADENEFSRAFTECQPGAEPPIGPMFGIPTVMDESLMGQDRVTFQAGTHEDAVTMSLADYMRLARPSVAQFGKNRA